MEEATLERLLSVCFHFCDILEEENCRSIKQISGGQGLGVGEGDDDKGAGCPCILGSVGTIPYLDGGVVILNAFMHTCRTGHRLEEVLRYVTKKYIRSSFCLSFRSAGLGGGGP